MNIDLCITEKDLDVYDWTVQYMKLKKFRVDVYVGGWFKTMPMHDYKKRAIFIDDKTYKNISVYLMNLYDMTLTKIDRFNEKDIQDIENILMTKKIKRRELQERYEFCLKIYTGSAEEKQKFQKNYADFLNLFSTLLR
ncbi:MAG: DUF6036 family nucleotidyltransferase [Nanoarchaeota archaeon]